MRWGGAFRLKHHLRPKKAAEIIGVVFRLGGVLKTLTQKHHLYKNDLITNFTEFTKSGDEKSKSTKKSVRGTALIFCLTELKNFKTRFVKI